MTVVQESELQNMCGIVGYIGKSPAADFLLDGLRRLEYRGYDSSGIATIPERGKLETTRAVGRIDKLSDRLSTTPLSGNIGIGHTRWATHGPPTQENAHPHSGGDNVLAIAHNGVIENYACIKTNLENQGYVFNSATDSEVIAHLIDSELNLTGPVNADPHARLVKAVEGAIAQLHGTYGLVVIFREHPDVIIAARLGSPLVIGVGKNENFVASDASPLVGYTDKIVYLADNQLAVIQAGSIHVQHRDEGTVAHNVRVLELEAADMELNEYPHYMLKEIFEQPRSLRDAMRGRLNEDDATAVFGGLNLSVQELSQVRRVLLTACGTSWHSSLYGEYVIEVMSRLPVEVEYASELRYRNPPVSKNTILFAITQSGETADTLAALREMKRKGQSTLAICNVVGSTIAQEADGGVYLHAGPEIGVA